MFKSPYVKALASQMKIDFERCQSIRSTDWCSTRAVNFPAR